MSSLPARINKIQLKMKALECSQDFSRYKSMGIYPESQGQITLQSMVGSGLMSNSSPTLLLSWLLGLGPICPKFEVCPDFMVVLVT